MKTTIKEKKTIGEMTYWEFVKEGGKFALICYAIIGAIYGVYLLISGKVSRKVAPAEENVEDVVTYDEDITYDEED